MLRGGKLKSLIKKIEQANLNRDDPKARICGKKDRYYDFERAKLAATLFERKTGEKMMAYHCRYCNLFHIGHKTR